MAGIGFELRKYLDDDSFTGTMKAYGISGIISAGPWVLSILGVMLIGLVALMESGSSEQVRQFTTSVTWMMGSSLVLTGMLQLVFTRFVADRLYEGHKELINANLFGALLLTTLCSAGIALLVNGTLFHESFAYEMLMLANFVVLSNIWIAVIFVAGLKRFKLILGSFALGYSVTVVMSLVLLQFGLNGLLCGLLLGHGLLLFMMLVTVLPEHPCDGSLRMDFLKRGQVFPVLIFIGLFYNAGIWIDKLIFWLMPGTSEAVIGPLRNSHIYDLPIFLAYISIIPGMAVFLLRIETDFAEAYADYYDAVRGKASLAQIEQQGTRMGSAVREGLLQILRVQGITVLLLYLLGPSIMQWLGMSPKYVHLFYIDIVGVAAQVLMLAVLNVLFYLDKLRQALLLCSLLLISNALLTLVSLTLGPVYYGYGFGLSMTLTAIVGIVLLSNEMQKIEYCTFMHQTRKGQATRSNRLRRLAQLLICLAGLTVGGALAETAVPAVPTPTLVKSDASTSAPVTSAAQDVVPSTENNTQGKSIAFYYATQPPVSMLSQFERLVLEPDNVTTQELEDLGTRGAVRYAYLSVGELGANTSLRGAVDSHWVLGRNSSWGSDVMDMTSEGWRQLLLARVDELQERGYQGLFLDTLDSYQLHVHSAQSRAAQEQALASLIRTIAETHPQLRLIANRGFEIVASSAPYLEAVAAESLFASWNNSSGQYLPVSDSARAWLSNTLHQIQQQYGLEMIVIDYLPPSRRDEAREVAKQIAAMGFTPWISTPAFDAIGIGTLEVMPREVLMMFDSRVNGPLQDSEVHKLVATPLEYLGYVPDYLDIASDKLPANQLRGRYAGIVSWTDDPYLNPDLSDWLNEQIAQGVPVAMFGSNSVPIDSTLSRAMGIVPRSRIDLATARVSHRDALIGFERQPLPRMDGVALRARSTASTNTVHLSYVDASGEKADLVVTGPWGGYALAPQLIDVDLDGTVYWIIDPFEFLIRALQLTSMPMPDITTDNGRRLWLAHIDGDALPSWAEMPGHQLGAEVIFDRLLTRYDLPHTVSVVEAEINNVPAYADRRARMIDIARRIFALPSVEIASHTYSHPFKWNMVGKQRNAGEHNIFIDGYVYSVEREVAGSVDWINHNLAPQGKRAQVFLWSGDAEPGEDALVVADRIGLLNVNGGNTVITRARPALSFVSPMARIVGSHTQIYAPIMNENVYTNDWTGPYDGFRRVIETLQMTDEPRRLKPLNIYYHFYAGTKIAAIRSLEEIYAWSMTQDISPVHVREYAQKVLDFRKAGVARTLDGRWRLSGLGTVQSLRVLQHDSWPDLISAKGVAGARALHDGIYLHTDGSDSVSFRLLDKAPDEPHLRTANARLLRWSTKEGRLHFRLVGHVPVVLEMAGTLSYGCTLVGGHRSTLGRRTADGTLRFEFPTSDTGDVALVCPA